MKKCYHFWIFILFVLSAGKVFSQYEIKGNVYLQNEANHANIKLTFQKQNPNPGITVVYTDSLGTFVANVDSGYYDVKIERSGYYFLTLSNQYFVSNTILTPDTLQVKTSLIKVPSDINTISEAIDQAYEGDTILVAPGNYFGSFEFFGKNIKLVSNHYLTGDTTFINSTKITSTQGSIFNFKAGEQSNFVLDGFTLYGSTSARGGAIYCENSTPTLQNLKIIDNSAPQGGGLYCKSNSGILHLNHIQFFNNIGTEGAAIYCDANVNISNCTIAYNTLSSASNIDLKGSVCLKSDTIRAAILDNLIIKFNKSVGSNAYSIGLFVKNFNIKATNLNLNNNSVDDAYTNVGGGIYLIGDNTLLTFKIENSIIAWNSADYGAGLFIEQYNINIENSTICYNNARQLGGAIYLGNKSSINIVNSIITNNKGNYGVYSLNPIVPYFSYSNFYDNEKGDFYNCGSDVGKLMKKNANGDSCDIFYNIKYDPRFSAPSVADFRLLPHSKCIDAGYNQYVYTALDLNYNQRLEDGNHDGNDVVDFGAYEYHAPEMSIAGQVIAPELNSGKVYLYWKNTNNNKLELIDFRDIDSSGTFIFHYLDSSSYALMAKPVSSGDIDYLSTFYGDVLDTLQAAIIDSTGEHYDINLVPVYSFKGEVKSKDQLIGKVYLLKYDSQNSKFELKDSVNYDTSGNFEFTIYEHGSFSFMANVSPSHPKYLDYVSTYYGNEDIESRASLIEKSNNQLGIEMLEYIQIAGHVVASNYKDCKVYLYLKKQNSKIVLIDSQFVNSSGNYSFKTLNIGSFTVLATYLNNSSLYKLFFPTYYGDEIQIANALFINQSSLNCDINLIGQWYISGRVLNAQNISFDVYLLEKIDNSYKIVDSLVNDPLGNYKFVKLKPSLYKVLVKPQPNSPYVNEFYPTFYGNVIQFDSAIVISNYGAKYDIDMIRKLSVKGKVNFRGNATGIVYLFKQNANNSFSLKDSVEMDQNGNFSFSQLFDGGYILKATLQMGSDDFEFYVPTYYGNVDDESQADLIMQSGDYYNIDIIYIDYISGFVDAGLTNHGKVYLIKKNVDDYQIIDTTLIDNYSRYMFKYFKPGEYLVFAHLDANDFFYKDYAPAYHLHTVNWEKSSVIMSPGKNYDIDLISCKTNSGFGVFSGKTVIRTNGDQLDPAPNTLLYLLDQNLDVVNYCFTNSDGSFRFDDLAEGNYRLHTEILGVKTFDFAFEISSQRAVYENVLLQVDSKSSEIFNDNSNAVILSLPFPNPVVDHINLNIFTKKDLTVFVKINDALGKQLSHGAFDLGFGDNSLNLDMSELAKQMYFINIYSDDKQFEPIKFKVVKE